MIIVRAAANTARHWLRDVRPVYVEGNPDHTPARALDIDDTGATFHEPHWCQPGDIFHEAAERLFNLHTR